MILGATSVFLVYVFTQAASIHDSRCGNIRNGFIKDPARCDGYLMCSNYAVIRERKCPARTSFDTNRNICMLSELARCGSISSDTHSAATEISRCGLENGVAADATRCNSFIICSQYKIKRRIACPKGTMFDDTARVCMLAYLVSCSTRPW